MHFAAPKEGAPVDLDPTNRYSVARALARRARALHNGAPRLIDSPSKNPTKIAVLEFEAGKLNTTKEREIPMQVIPNKKPVEQLTQSRLPAGSTMLLPNGIRVAHPHAEVNLAGEGDGRLSADAVSENLDDLDESKLEQSSGVVAIPEPAPAESEAKA